MARSTRTKNRNRNQRHRRATAPRPATHSQKAHDEELPEKARSNGLAFTAMLLGVGAVLFGFLVPELGLALAGASIYCGVMEIRRPKSYRGLALAGMALSLVAVTSGLLRIF